MIKDFDRLLVRFRQFGGWRLLVQYARMGVLGTGMREILRCAFHRQSMKQVYPKITHKVDEILLEKYKAPLLSPQGGKDAPSTSPKEESLSWVCNSAESSPFGGIRGGLRGNGEGAIIWFSWLQGLEAAPPLVHACLRSLQSLPDAEVVVINRDNYQDYIEFPPHILEKYRKGRIPHVTMSDMLRLALLARYGGVWIDATVLATYREEHAAFWQSIRQSPLFFYRYFSGGRVVGISTWFIAAHAGNPIIIEALQQMYAYWKDYDCLVDYYLIHLFLSASANRHPESVGRMPRGNSRHALLLAGSLEKPYDAAAWDDLTSHVPFHKLSYRHTDKAQARSDSYYNHILSLHTGE